VHIGRHQGIFLPEKRRYEALFWVLDIGFCYDVFKHHKLFFLTILFVSPFILIATSGGGFLMVYCEHEQKQIPDREFIHLKNGAIFQPYIHDVTPLHFADGTLIVLPTRSSASPSRPFSASPPPGLTPERPGGVPTVEEIKDSGSRGIVALRASLALQLYQMAQDMPIEKLQALVKYATDLGGQGNE
jgi:hypothetical protein